MVGGVAVQENRRQRPRQQRRIDPPRVDRTIDQACDRAWHQLPQQRLFGFAFAAGHGAPDQEPLRRGRLADAIHRHGGPRVSRHFVHHKGYRAPGRHLRAGTAVGLIAKALCGLKHAAPGCSRKLRTAHLVQHQRHGGLRHPGFQRHLIHRGAAPVSGALVFQRTGHGFAVGHSLLGRSWFWLCYLRTLDHAASFAEPAPLLIDQHAKQDHAAHHREVE
jgi:hypothetical protein